MNDISFINNPITELNRRFNITRIVIIAFYKKRVHEKLPKFSNIYRNWEGLINTSIVLLVLDKRFSAVWANCLRTAAEPDLTDCNTLDNPIFIEFEPEVVELDCLEESRFEDTLSFTFRASDFIPESVKDILGIVWRSEQECYGLEVPVYLHLELHFYSGIWKQVGFHSQRIIVLYTLRSYSFDRRRFVALSGHRELLSMLKNTTVDHWRKTSQISVLTIIWSICISSISCECDPSNK